jgi:hypothetical protein
MEADALSETLCFLVCRISDNGQSKKTNSEYNLLFKESETTEGPGF